MANNATRQQISSSTCPHPPTFSHKLKWRSTSLPFPRERTYGFLFREESSKWQNDLISRNTGDYKMARQTRLHPPPHRRRNQRSRRHGLAFVTRSSARLRACEETGMVDNAWYGSTFILVLSFHGTDPTCLPSSHQRIPSLPSTNNTNLPSPYHRCLHPPRLCPIGESGGLGGGFCPIHGAHDGNSGRARKGPAPLNLAVPEYEFPEDEKVIIG